MFDQLEMLALAGKHGLKRLKKQLLKKKLQIFSRSSPVHIAHLASSQIMAWWLGMQLTWRNYASSVPLLSLNKSISSTLFVNPVKYPHI